MIKIIAEIGWNHMGDIGDSEFVDRNDRERSKGAVLFS
tara:strand:- start:385 stop:498 length:114 start_codon:yes stop_codon:yes gene_type:complete